MGKNVQLDKVNQAVLLFNNTTNRIKNKHHMMILRTGYCKQIISVFIDSKRMNRMRSKD
jgi:hypothetical protein